MVSHRNPFLNFTRTEFVARDASARGGSTSEIGGSSIGEKSRDKGKQKESKSDSRCVRGSVSSTKKRARHEN